MKTACILPVFNEEKTVKKVLKVLLESKLLDEIVVVNDGSTDNTLKIVKQFDSGKLRIIDLRKNLGKSAAVKIGVMNTNSEILMFCDGDLHNFSTQHIKKILKPLIQGKYLMTVGIRDRGLLHNVFVNRFGPLITGERAMPRKIFEEISNHPLMKDYAMEFVLNNYCKKNNVPIKKMILKGVKQTNKPYKYDNKLKGMVLLVKQSVALLIVYIKLRIIYE